MRAHFPGLRRAAALAICLMVLCLTAHAQGISADSGSIAIGGNVTDSTINIGVPLEKIDALIRERTKPLEELTSSQRETIGLLKEKLDLNERQVRAALDIIGEKNVPPERLAAKLAEIAERYKALQATALAQPGDDAKIVALKADAQKAIEAGELAKADDLLAAVETEQRRALDSLALNAADTLGKRGDIALTRLRYAEAARHFASAAAMLPPGSTHEDKRIDYLEREAGALYKQGDEFGNNEALRSAIELYKRLLDLKSRERLPLEWAADAHNLGAALFRLGERERGSARLDEAVAAYREALRERTRERAPLDWVDTQTALGAALFRLGEHESGTVRLAEAAAAYIEALKEGTRERAPLKWAMLQTVLGNVFIRLGERQDDSSRYEQAVAAYREALKEWTRERVPRQWAAIQNNLGVTLTLLAVAEGSVARLDEAVVAYREALKETTRERLPLDWAETQSNLGAALISLGERDGDTTRLEEAVAACNEALREQTRDRVPLAWAISTGNQGVALIYLAERTNNAVMAKRAVEQIESALETTRARGDPRHADYFQSRLAKARAMLGQLRGQ